MKITSSEADSFIEENLLNDNDERAINDIMLKIKIREDKDNRFSSDSSLDNSDEWNNLLDSLINERKAFVTKCRQEFDNSKLPEYFDRWTIKQQYYHLISNVSKYFPNIPESLRSILPAIFENGNFNEQRGNTKPDWLIMDKFYRGQRFTERYFSVIYISQIMGLIQIFSFSDGMKTLIFSQESNTPYNAFTRYLRTVQCFKNWYTSDPWCQGTPAYREIQRVRRLHSAMRSKLCKKSFEEIDRDSKIQNAWCPILGKITKDLADTCPMAKSQQCPYTMIRTKSLNQGDMAGTLFSCMGLVVLYPEQFGIYASDEDLEAFCHFWRGLGYLLGLEDQYNFCRGSLQEVRQRSKDFIEHWIKPNFREVTPEWEHMIMCVFEGLVYMDLPSNYKVCILYLCDILELNMPRLYSSFSLSEKIFYALQKFIFSYMMKLPGVNFIINKIINVFLNRAATFESDKHAQLKKKSSKMFEEFIPLKYDNRAF